MLTYDQLKTLAAAAGVDSINDPVVAGNLTGGVSSRMAAIAIAESGDKSHPEKGANPMAHNTVAPDNSYGLWQINMIGNLGPERRKLFGISKNEDLFDPATNAKAMAIILRKQGPTAWSTYQNGSDLAVLKNLKKAGVSDVPNTFTPVSDVTNGVPDAITSGFNVFSKSLFGVAVNAGVFLAAVVFVILGIILLARGPIVSLAGKTPIGRVVKKVA